MRYRLILPLIFVMMYTIFVPFGYAQRAQDVTNDEYLTEYRDEVRRGRPSLTYAVFEPVIIFFKSVYAFIDTVVSVLHEKISEILNKDS